MNIDTAGLEYTRDISVDISRNMLGANDPQFIRIHHNFHHLVLYVKDFVMKEQCKTYLEVGAHYGHSLCNALQSKYPTKYMAIDLFKRFGDGGVVDMQKLANDNAEKYNVNNYEYKVVRGNSQAMDTVLKVKEYFPEGIDLLFIDGDHSYKGVTNDFNLYFPLVNSGGYIIFDDYLPYKLGNYERPAPKAINDLLKANQDKIVDIGLVDDTAEVYKIKPHDMDLGGKNIDYIIQKL
jgi:predicted O-methyltransferase YrrM